MANGLERMLGDMRGGSAVEKSGMAPGGECEDMAGSVLVCPKCGAELKVEASESEAPEMQEENAGMIEGE